MQGRIRDLFTLFGFREVLTPARSTAEVIEEHGLGRLRKLFDEDNQMLLLRPEIPPPSPRHLPAPGGQPTAAQALRRPSLPTAAGGRGSAELYQAGVEVVGSASPREDG